MSDVSPVEARARRLGKVKSLADIEFSVCHNGKHWEAESVVSKYRLSGAEAATPMAALRLCEEKARRWLRERVEI